jgi:N-acetylglucosamine-6-sulfatase
MHRRPGRVDVLRLEGAVPEPGEPRRKRGTSPEEICRDQMRCLAAVDEGVGQLFDALEKQGTLDDTVIVYTADNGYLMGEHKQFDTKRYAYEESIRVPFIVRYPKLVPAGGRRKQLALNVDLAPTLLEIAGVEPLMPMHGQSLVPVLRDENAPGRKSILTEYFQEKIVPAVPDWQSVRTERWKYIRFPGLDDMDELYDLANDPHELKNLAQDDSSASKLAELQAELDRLLERAR